MLLIIGLCILGWTIIRLWWPMYKEDLSEYHLDYKEFIEDSFYLQEGEDENGIPERSERTVFVYHPQLNTNIIMRYNYDRDGFEYWANSTLSFETLLAVCRKYCRSFNAWGLYKGCKTRREHIGVKQEEKVIEDKLNKFIEMGTVRDYAIIVPKKNIKELDFKTFKLLNIPKRQ
jgi:hypothetical protein